MDGEILQRLAEQGVLGIVLGLVLWGFWKACAWLAKNFLVPIRDRFLQHIDNLTTAIESLMSLMRDQGELMRSQAKSIKMQNDILEHIEGTVKDAHGMADDQVEVLNRVDKKLDELTALIKQSQSKDS